MSDKTYLQFDLLIDRGATGYRVRVLNSPAGQASGALTLPPDFAASADWSAPAAARVQGQRLFEAVLAGDV
ncbi:MAG: hypothetical protein WAV66_17555, partial [Anaerolineae bacterium]